MGHYDATARRRGSESGLPGIPASARLLRRSYHREAREIGARDLTTPRVGGLARRRLRARLARWPAQPSVSPAAPAARQASQFHNIETARDSTDDRTRAP